jgi:hypothetical protein
MVIFLLSCLLQPQPALLKYPIDRPPRDILEPHPRR